MKAVVIDASMAASWTVDDEKTEIGDSILDEVKDGQPIAPSLFWHEYRNILVSNQRRGRIAKERVYVLLQEIRLLKIEERNPDDKSVISLAFRHDITAYDAAYLALAVRDYAVLATNDRKLARAALAEGLELLTTLSRDQITP